MCRRIRLDKKHYECDNELTNWLIYRIGGDVIKIKYANQRVEKYFSDYTKMKKKLPFDWVKTIKKHMDRLRAAETFGDFLKLGLGHPEQLRGYAEIRYSLRVAKHARLIIELNAVQDTVTICEEIEVKGVSDYHGDKENWYLP